jgi:intein/homing endonuclease
VRLAGRVGLPVGTPLGLTTTNHGIGMPLADPAAYPPRIRPFQVDLRDLGVLGNKHIPDLYSVASTGQRLALLQGLMDTDGSIYKTSRSVRVEYTSTSSILADGVLCGCVPWSGGTPGFIV